MLSMASIVLVLNNNISDNYFLIKDFWALWSIGIIIGIIGLIIAYKYKKLIEEQKITKYNLNWEKKFQKELKEEQKNASREEIRKLEYIIKNKAIVKAMINELLIENNTQKTEDFITILPENVKSKVISAVNVLNTLRIDEEKSSEMSDKIINFIIDPASKKSLDEAINNYIDSIK